MKYFKKKNKRKSTLFLALFLGLLFLFSFIIFKNHIHQIVVQLHLANNLYQKIRDKRVSFLNFIHDNKIEEIHIDMSPNNFVKLQKERSKMTFNYLTTRDKWHSKNQYYKVKYKNDFSKTKGKIRLFGLNSDHFRDPKKHSFRMKFNGSTGFGKKKVNYMNPRCRNFILDVFSNELFNELEGGIKLKYKVVNIIFNKVDYGYYIREDFFDKYLLEENERRESVIFEIINDKFYYNHIGKDDEFLPIANELLDLFKNDYSTFLTLFDIEKIKAILMISLILHNTHSLIPINLHWYFNPVTGLIEPTIRESNIKEMSYLTVKDINFDNLDYQNKILNDLYKMKIKDSFQDYLLKNLPIATKVMNEDPDYNAYKKKMLGFNYEIKKKEDGINSNLKVLLKKIEKHSPKNEVKEDTIFIKKDTIITDNWTIKKNQTLIINSGVHLRLDGVYLKIYGGLKILGDSKNRVTIEGSPTNPSTIFINSTHPILIVYADFNYFTNLKSRFDQPSSITFYESSDVLINNCTFSNNLNGDDYLNFFRSKNITIKNSFMKNCLNDAIDSDFSDLKIESVLFEDIGNDAIDGSGSNIQVNNCSFFRVKDKAISAGEKSFFEVSFSKFIGNEIALVSKDESYLISKENFLSNNRLDLVSFKKKKIFGYPRVDILNTPIKNYLIEKKSIIKGIKKITYSSNVESKLYGNLYGKSSK